MFASFTRKMHGNRKTRKHGRIIKLELGMFAPFTRKMHAHSKKAAWESGQSLPMRVRWFLPARLINPDM